MVPRQTVLRRCLGSHQFYMRPPIALKRSLGGALGSAKMPVAPLHELGEQVVDGRAVEFGLVQDGRVQLYASSLIA